MPNKNTAKTKSARKPAALVIVGILSLTILFAVLLNDDKSQLQVNGHTLDYILADSKEERAQGLSGRTNLSDNEAMIFDFPESGLHGIWMKDMNFSIDIIWLDADKKVVHIERNIAPETYPESFYPPTPAKYVVEVNAGEADALELETGDTFQF